MSKRELKDVLVEIKATQDIVDYIQSAAVALKPSSNGKYKGLCPFHGEKTPSFTVDSNFQNYRCFGCGASGDIVNFVQEYENLSFIESVRKLADLSNIQFELEDSDSKYDYRAIRACAADAAKFFQNEFSKLDGKHKAKREITGKTRRLPIDGTVLYGYAPESGKALYSYLSKKGYSNEVILQTGVCKKVEDKDRYYDFWRGRLMFIITDPAGNPVGFSGRKLNEDDKGGKYINSPEGPIFDKSSILFHHSEAKQDAKKDKTIYIAEGQFDVSAISAAGIKNVVASSGTALTKKQILMCSRMVGDSGKIVFCFDGDEAGKKAAYRSFSLAGELQGQCYVVSLPDGKDPCDYRLANGDDGLRDFLSNRSIPIVEFVLEVIADRYSLRDPSQSARYVDEAATVLKTIASPSLRSNYAKRVALKSLMSISAVEDAIARAKVSEELPERSRRIDEEEVEDFSNTREVLLTNSQREILFVEDLFTNSLKNVFGRMLYLALFDRSLIEELSGVAGYPKPFLVIAKEVGKLSEDEPVIIEKSKLPLILKTVIESDFFPYLNVMDREDIHELFSNLREEASSIISLRELKKESRRVMEVLGDSNDPELLRMASGV